MHGISTVGSASLNLQPNPQSNKPLLFSSTVIHWLSTEFCGNADPDWWLLIHFEFSHASINNAYDNNHSEEKVMEQKAQKNIPGMRGALSTTKFENENIGMSADNAGGDSDTGRSNGGAAAHYGRYFTFLFTYSSLGRCNPSTQVW